MMRWLLTSWLICLAGMATAAPEWQIFFPDQATVVNGVYVDVNEALVIKQVDNLVMTERLDLATETGLDIPDHVAVTGFTTKDNGGPSSTSSYIFSLSAATGNFQKGDVIECNNDGCVLRHSFGENVGISALDYINRIDVMTAAFDKGFEFNGEYISPLNVYRVSDFVQVFDGLNANLSDSNGISAFDTSEFAATLSPQHMYDSVDGLVTAAEVFSTSVDTETAIADQLADQVTGIGAYYSLNSGWLEFEAQVINVSEGAGSVSLDIARVDGVENLVSVVTRDNDGTAVDGVDYEGTLFQYLWSDGDDSNRTLTINLIDNDLLDGTRSFTVELLERNSNYSFALVNPNKNLVTVNIIDDDGDLIFADSFE